MRALRKGYKGNDVKGLQIKLNKLGYNCGTPDGSFGSNTDKAVRKFQSDNRLVVDGSVGNATMGRIDSLLKNSSNSNIGNDNETNKVLKYKTLNYIIIDPNKIQMVVANKKYQKVSSRTAINGTYFWKGQPNGIMVYKSKDIGSASSHAWRGYGQSVIYFDGKNFGVKRVRYASELGNVKWAIGGCGMITPYGYSPTSEGFNGKYVDILRTCNKTVIGAKDGKVYLITVPNMSHGTLLTRLREMGLELAISVDGGGSTFMKCNGKVIMPTDGRTVNNWVVVKE